MPEPVAIPDTAQQDALYWLGQAGFRIDPGGHRVLIDPYPGDSLAVNYAGTKYPHTRMMPIPVSVAALPDALEGADA